MAITISDLVQRMPQSMRLRFRNSDGSANQLGRKIIAAYEAGLQSKRQPAPWPSQTNEEAIAFAAGVHDSQTPSDYAESEEAQIDLPAPSAIDFPVEPDMSSSDEAAEAAVEVGIDLARAESITNPNDIDL